MRKVVETAAFRVKDGTTEEDVIQASNLFQSQFLGDQPGFLRRELLKLNDRDYLDVVHWGSASDAAAVLEKATNSMACQQYFSVMDEASADLGAGVSHYESLAVYPSRTRSAGGSLA